jgi:hypothetical protein
VKGLADDKIPGPAARGCGELALVPLFDCGEPSA